MILINLDSKRGTAKLELPMPVTTGTKFESTEDALYAVSDIEIAQPQQSFNIIVPARSITTLAYAIDPAYTGIGDINISTTQNRATQDNTYTTLDGVRHSHPMRGINLHQGRKIVNK